jgi:hypothetical protein|nr:MAG TPA: nonstructural protein [Caudoviricetes sp.]
MYNGLYDIEKRMKRSCRKFAILQGVVIAFIAVAVVSSIVLSIFMYKGLFSADIPEWMKWAFVFLGR